MYLPPHYQKLVVNKLSTNFREATDVVVQETSSLSQSLKENDVLIKILYAGINASDINYSAGRYDPTLKPPFDVGFEGLGVVVQLGSSVKHLQTGQYVAIMEPGTFSEYKVVSSHKAIPIPSPKPEYLGLLVSGLTAFFSVQVAMVQPGESVLVTAAAGGLGQILVQLLKKKGCRVMGTCSSVEKEIMLKNFGCDKVINYKTQDLSDELRQFAPNGVQVVFESVGGTMLKTCLKHLANKGRCIILGSISTYSSNQEHALTDKIPTGLLLTKSMTITGLFLFHYVHQFKSAMSFLLQEFESGNLTVGVDVGSLTGMTGIYEAIDYLHKGKNTGKVVVKIQDSIQHLL